MKTTRVVGVLVLAYAVMFTGSVGVQALDDDPATPTYSAYQSKFERWDTRVNQVARWVERGGGIIASLRMLTNASLDFGRWANSVTWDECYADEADKVTVMVLRYGLKTAGAWKAWALFQYRRAVSLTREALRIRKAVTHYYANVWSDC